MALKQMAEIDVNELVIPVPNEYAEEAARGVVASLRESGFQDEAIKTLLLYAFTELGVVVTIEKES